MADKKTVKLNFVDFASSFDKRHNNISSGLSKRYNLEISENPDFLFYSCFSTDYMNYQDCVKIFYTSENILPNFNECDYGSGFDYIDFGDRYFRRPCSIPAPSINDRTACTPDFFNRRFCNFIYSNGSTGEGAKKRQEFCQKLMEYKHVDCPGKILNNMTTDELEPRKGDWARSKLEFLKKYKFTIAFENSSSNGYTTEKLTQPLQSFSIPIYWGNPLVTKDFNPKAFINCNDYDNDFDAVIERVKELDNDPDKYLAMLRENPMQPDFDFDRQEKYIQWLISIIEKGNNAINKDPCRMNEKSLKRTIRSLKQENADLKAQIENSKSDDFVELTNKNKLLSEENVQLRENVQNMEKRLKDIAKPKPFLEFPTKSTGNFLCRRIEKNGYVKTYICGICIRKRPVNLCQFIDSRLYELEKRIKASQN